MARQLKLTRKPRITWQMVAESQAADIEALSDKVQDLTRELHLITQRILEQESLLTQIAQAQNVQTVQVNQGLKELRGNVYLTLGDILNLEDVRLNQDQFVGFLRYANKRTTQETGAPPKRLFHGDRNVDAYNLGARRQVLLWLNDFKVEHAYLFPIRDEEMSA